MTKREACEFFAKYGNVSTNADELMRDRPRASQLKDALLVAQKNPACKWPEPMYALEAMYADDVMINSSTGMEHPVRCYMDGSFEVGPHHVYSNSKMIGKTLTLRCGTYDGENINLFQLQEWFDKNRTWIDEQKKWYLEDDTP